MSTDAALMHVRGVACRVALTNMTSVKRFVATAKIEEVRVSLGTEGIGRCVLTHTGRQHCNLHSQSSTCCCVFDC